MTSQALKRFQCGCQSKNCLFSGHSERTLWEIYSNKAKGENFFNSAWKMSLQCVLPNKFSSVNLWKTDFRPSSIIEWMCITAFFILKYKTRNTYKVSLNWWFKASLTKWISESPLSSPSCLWWYIFWKFKLILLKNLLYKMLNKVVNHWFFY